MRKTVLIVDDDDPAREVVSLYFQSLGFDIYQARNGEEGLKLLENQAVDLIFLDLAMPVMTGEELLLKMMDVERLRDIPIIIDTAQGAGTGRLAKVEQMCGGKLKFASFTRPGSMANLGETVQRLLQ